MSKNATTTPTSNHNTVAVKRVHFDSFRVRIIGRTPLIMHAMSAKAKLALLVGKQTKNKAAKQATIKNPPPHECFVDCLIRLERGPTALGFYGHAFKEAMATATKVADTVTKTDILSMCHVIEHKVPIYGIPKLRMDVVRNSGINRAPDIRTRAILDKWGCELTIRYVENRLGMNTLLTLLANAGDIVGIGDWRPEKGGHFGRFDITSTDTVSEEWTELLAQGREAQETAIADPVLADEETAALYAMYEDEVRRRR